MIRLYDINGTCPICKKPKECLIADDYSSAICYHIKEGAVKRCGKAGWLHILKPGQFVPKEYIKPPKPDINWDLLHHIFLSSKPPQGTELELGITSSTLALYGMGWDKETNMFTFPMRDETGQIIGIQRRNNKGDKYCVAGSTPGLFIPDILIPTYNLIMACEGLSDAAVATELGFGAIGKYNWSTGEGSIPKIIEKMTGVGIVIIVSDKDEDGKYGSEILKQNLRKINMDSIIISPSKAKDLREYYVRFNLTQRQLCGIIRTEIKKQLYGR